MSALVDVCRAYSPSAPSFSSPLAIALDRVAEAYAKGFLSAQQRTDCKTRILQMNDASQLLHLQGELTAFVAQFITPNVSMKQTSVKAHVSGTTEKPKSQPAFATLPTTASFAAFTADGVSLQSLSAHPQWNQLSFEEARSQSTLKSRAKAIPGPISFGWVNGIPQEKSIGVESNGIKKSDKPSAPHTQSVPTVPESSGSLSHRAPPPQTVHYSPYAPDKSVSLLHVSAMVEYNRWSAEELRATKYSPTSGVATVFSANLPGQMPTPSKAVMPSTTAATTVENRSDKRTYTVGGGGLELNPVFEWQQFGTLLVCKIDEHFVEPRCCKVAAFDVDGTLLQRQLYSDRDVTLRFSSVRPYLRGLVSDGYRIVTFSNQLGVGNGSLNVSELKERVERLGRQLAIPLTMMFACARDQYRKPEIGMWEHFLSTSRIHPDPTSFFVGDAAGRPGDFSDSDRKFAMNIHLSFRVPEQFFLGEPAPALSPLAATIENRATDGEVALPISAGRRMVVCVGRPSCGKSAYLRRHVSNWFPTGDVCVISQELYQSRDACLQACNDAAARGHNIVIDNSNPSAMTRSLYLDIARAHGYRTTCLHFVASAATAIHLSVVKQRLAKASSDRHLARATPAAFQVYDGCFVLPNHGEGFEEVHRVEFVPHFESDFHQQQFERLS